MSRDTEAAFAAKADIRAAGLRATPARVATLLELREATGPLTHAEVSERLSGLAIDKATIFRSLNTLVEARLSRRFEVGDHVYRFERVAPDEAVAEPHPHFLCTDCGVVSCLDHAAVAEKIRHVCGAIGDVTEIVLRGRCRDCQ